MSASCGHPSVVEVWNCCYCREREIYSKFHSAADQVRVTSSDLIIQPSFVKEHLYKSSDKMPSKVLSAAAVPFIGHLLLDAAVGLKPSDFWGDNDDGVLPVRHRNLKKATAHKPTAPSLLGMHNPAKYPPPGVSYLGAQDVEPTFNSFNEDDAAPKKQDTVRKPYRSDFWGDNDDVLPVWARDRKKQATAHKPTTPSLLGMHNPAKYPPPGVSYLGAQDDVARKGQATGHKQADGRRRGIFGMGGFF